LPARVLAQLARPNWRPLGVLWTLARAEAGGLAATTLLASLLSSALIPIEALLLAGLLDMGEHRALSYEQLVWMLAIVALIAAGLWLDAWLGRATVGMGRALELRLRAALLAKLPRLEENYLRSRPTSDMANRAHGLHGLRRLPTLWTQIAREAGAVVALVLGLLWLHPEGGLAIAGLAAAALLLPLQGRARAAEKSSRLLTHSAALDRFALDALLGSTPLAAHGAGRAMENAHEAMLGEWATTARELDRHQTLARAVQLCVATATAAALLVGYWARGGPIAGLLPLAFLALRVPAAADSLLAAIFAVRDLRSLGLRTLAPLAAPTAPADEPLTSPESSSEPSPAARPRASGLRLRLKDVGILAGGHPLLRHVSLDLEPGDHVAIVGESGAGKSSLIGLLLGLLQASEGELWVDGERVDAAGVRALREHIAWVDPAVQLWDRSLLDNLCYGDDAELEAKLPGTLEAAELLDVLPQLPAGLQTGLGENGGRVSGGQGQRIRLGRALLRSRPRLVLLDEPFRGLPHEQRRALSARLRQIWHGSTLLFVSHDVDDTSEFEHVIVLERGQIVEAGPPRELLRNAAGRYAALHRSAQALGGDVWRSGTFEQRTLVAGELRRNQPHNDPCNEHGTAGSGGGLA
jgi:ATP-binding cassette subfamily B protein